MIEMLRDFNESREKSFQLWYYIQAIEKDVLTGNLFLPGGIGFNPRELPCEGVRAANHT